MLTTSSLFSLLLALIEASTDLVRGTAGSSSQGPPITVWILSGIQQLEELAVRLMDGFGNSTRYKVQ
jgi:hypothetical protein